MSEWIDSRTRLWAVIAIIAGIALLIGRELIEEPNKSLTGLLL